MVAVGFSAQYFSVSLEVCTLPLLKDGTPARKDIFCPADEAVEKARLGVWKHLDSNLGSTQI